MTPSLLLALGLAAAPVADAPRLAVSLRSGGALLLAPSRTHGGAGGGVGVRVALDRHWLLHGDVAVLWGLGTAGLMRVGAGWQRVGEWAPLVRADVELGFGDRFDFSADGRLPASAMSLGLGVSVGLLRFQVAGATLSALELGAGVGTDLLTAGPRLGVTLLELSVPLGG